MGEPKVNNADIQINFNVQEILDDLCIRFILNCPEEAYESFERLFFQIEEAHWFYDDFYRENAKKKRINLPAYGFKEFAELIFDRCPHLNLHRRAVVNHTKNFYNYKSSVPVYGAIILNSTFDKVLLAMGYYSKNWSFPRGKINKNESEVDCAIREVKEEIGVDIAHLIKADDFVIAKLRQQTVKLYVVAGVSETVKFAPQTRKEVSGMQWHRIDDILSNGRSSPKKTSSKTFHLVMPFIRELMTFMRARKISRGSELPIVHSAPIQISGSKRGIRAPESQRERSSKAYEQNPSAPYNISLYSPPREIHMASSAPVPSLHSFVIPARLSPPPAGYLSEKVTTKPIRSGFSFSFKTEEIISV